MFDSFIATSVAIVLWYSFTSFTLPVSSVHSFTSSLPLEYMLQHPQAVTNDADSAMTAESGERGECQGVSNVGEGSPGQ